MAFEPFVHFIKGIQTRLTGNNLRGGQSVQSAHQMAYLRQIQREIRQDDVLKVPLKELDVVVLDIETTGFYPDKGDEIISIGAIKISGGIIQEEQTFYSLIQCKNIISDEITELTAITNEQVKDAPPLSDVLVQFFQFARNSTLVAHHSSHEKNFLQHASWQMFRTPLRHRILDTSFLYRIADPDLNIVRLEDFCDHYKIPIVNRHHALEDAIVTAKLWSIYIEKVINMGCNSLTDVYERLAQLRN
ncbi:3'-5' exoribonuclease [Bacillus sp. AGMB 02131]|uniref:3'-5' exoribonuclease n=1 Tax=Peribacillus faecalis TaxID=2772559 RepID=A0A927HB62_9BACI|nr:exonuclease domain-containing protein [Peribacillus faecalis]MBD3108262.1 3'-5' exoribonuclease [Peribacillus faecalis]